MNNEISEDEDFVELINLIANERIPRIFRQRPDYFLCLRDFELSKIAVLYVHDLILSEIKHPTDR